MSSLLAAEVWRTMAAVVVSLKDDGRRAVARIAMVDDPAPPQFASLNQAELKSLAALLARLASSD
jgi:hypothetical protein